MRILVVPKDFPSPAQPGAGVFVLSQIHALRRLGHEVHVVRFVPHAPPVGAKWNVYRSIPDRYEYEGVPVKTVRAFYPPRMIGMEYLALQVGSALRREARRTGAQIVHAHCVIPEGNVAVHQALPTVVTAHGSDAYSWSWRRPGLTRAAREAISRASHVVAVSDFIRRQVLRLADRDVSVIYNGADETIFAPQDRHAARSELGIDKDRRVIAFAGRLHEAKGLRELIGATAQLHELRPLLLMAGEGPERERAQQTAAQAGVDVRFMGLLAPPALARVFAACDVMTLPSYNEGLPVVVCEAMLSGRAVVATPVGGVPEIVREGETGLLVPVRNAGALSESLRAVIANDALRDRMERSAVAFAREHLTWRLNAEAHDRIYRELVETRSGEKSYGPREHRHAAPT